MLVRPEILGLPSVTGKAGWTLRRAVELLHTALIAGDGDAARRTLLDLFLAGQSLAAIGDDVIRPAFQRIGCDWEAGRLEVYRERAACETVLEILRELKGRIPAAAANAPLAVGGNFSGDEYTLAGRLVELVCIESGWSSTLLGTNLPGETLLAALGDLRPRVFWLSVSHVANQARLEECCRQLYQSASELQTLFVIGGRAVDETLRGRLPHSVFSPHLRHFANLLGSLGERSQRESS